MLKYLKSDMPKNYHLTFSRNEANDFQSTQVLIETLLEEFKEALTRQKDLYENYC